MKIAKSLLRVVRERELVKEELALLTYRLFFKFPSKSFDDLEIPLPASISNITDEHERHCPTALHVKMIERSKTIRMAQLIDVTEHKLRYYEQQVENEIYQIWHPSLNRSTANYHATTSGILRQQRPTNSMAIIIEQRMNYVIERTR